MRKYYQLLLVVMSVVSFVALLFYHHEYHRLRYVLEVLNFFGKPSENLQCPTMNETTLWERVNGFSSPSPVWTQLSENHYVYSAFWEKNEVVAVATGPASNGFTGRNSFQCEIWLEGKDDPFVGKVVANVIDSKTKKKVGFVGYHLTCKTEKISLLFPEEVTFWRTQDKVPSKVAVPIHHFSERLPFLSSSLSMTVCVPLEESQRISAKALTSFVSYHTLLGVTDFILYGGNRYSHIVNVLQKHGSSISALPWNYPLSGNGLSELERDCRSRAWPATDNVVVLPLNEYVVPVHHSSLPGMLNDLDAQRKLTARFQLSTNLYCTNYPDDTDAEPTWPLFMHKTFFDPGAKTESVNIYRPGALVSNRASELGTYLVSPSIAAVHRFSNCNIPIEAPTDTLKFNPQIRRFASDLMKSVLLNVHLSPK